MRFLFVLILTFLSLPGFGQEDDEKMIDELQAAQEKQRTALQEIQKVVPQKRSETENFVPDEIKKLGHNKIDAIALMDDRVVEVVRKMMKDNMSRVSREQIKQGLQEKAQGSLFEGFFQSNPKSLELIVDIVKDEKALYEALGIFLRKDDLKLYFCIWLGLIILSWLFKKIVFNREWSQWKLRGLNFLMALIVTATSFTIFYNIFYKELSPTIQIIARYW